VCHSTEVAVWWSVQSSCSQCKSKLVFFPEMWSLLKNPCIANASTMSDVIMYIPIKVFSTTSQYAFWRKDLKQITSWCFGITDIEYCYITKFQLLLSENTQLAAYVCRSLSICWKSETQNYIGTSFQLCIYNWNIHGTCIGISRTKRSLISCEEEEEERKTTCWLEY